MENLKLWEKFYPDDLPRCVQGYCLKANLEGINKEDVENDAEFIKSKGVFGTPKWRIGKDNLSLRGCWK